MFFTLKVNEFYKALSKSTSFGLDCITLYREFV